MKLSPSEKLILLMLSEIHEKLEIKNGVNPELIKAAIISNQTWGLDWEYSGLLAYEEASPPLVAETTDILDMWAFLEDSYAKFSDAEKATIKKDAEPFGEDVQFWGFDGNHDPHYHITHFLIQDMKRFTRFKDHPLNSHSQAALIGYRRMYSAFENIRPKLDGRLLTVAEITQILNARAANPERKLKAV